MTYLVLSPLSPPLVETFNYWRLIALLAVLVLYLSLSLIAMKTRRPPPVPAKRATFRFSIGSLMWLAYCLGILLAAAIGLAKTSELAPITLLPPLASAMVFIIVCWIASATHGTSQNAAQDETSVFEADLRSSVDGKSPTEDR